MKKLIVAASAVAAAGRSAGFRAQRRLALLMALGIVGCTTPGFSPLIAPEQTRVPLGSRVLLMPPSVTIGEYTASGARQELADETQEARAYLLTALQDELSASAVETVTYEALNSTVSVVPEHAPMITLHRAVQGAINEC